MTEDSQPVNIRSPLKKMPGFFSRINPFKKKGVAPSDSPNASPHISPGKDENAKEKTRPRNSMFGTASPAKCQDLYKDSKSSLQHSATATFEKFDDIDNKVRAYFSILVFLCLKPLFEIE